MKQQPMGYAGIEQACKYVFLFVGHSYDVDVAVLLYAVEIFDHRIKIKNFY